MKTHQQIKNRYFIYVRKSSEPDDRQVLSIPSQIKELKAKFGELSIVAILEESMSAKAPGRPIFERMIERIEAGEADGVISWHPDRLARNSVDGGKIIYLLDIGKLVNLKFGSYTFENTPEGKWMLNIVFGQSKYFVDKLSKDVKRGNRAKYDMGGITWVGPQGYINNLINHTIEPDPERFNLVRRMWDMLLSGYRVSQILEAANEGWSYRTIKRKKSGGRPLHLSTLYAIFTNPLYYGVNIRPDGTIHSCTHRPMITEQEFWRAQAILGRKGKARPKKYEFPFTDSIRCGECGGMVTAEEKKKISRKTGEPFIYYHCTKKKPGIKCSQLSIEAHDLDQQIAYQLARMSISEKFKNYAVKYLHEMYGQEVTDRTQIFENQQKAYNEIQKQLDSLLDVRLQNLISDQEYKAKKENLIEQQTLAYERLEDTKHRAEEWIELTENTFHFACYASYWFEYGSLQDKKIILQTMGGSNLTLKDKKLVFEPDSVFTYLANRPENASWQGMRESNSPRLVLETGPRPSASPRLYYYTTLV